MLKLRSEEKGEHDFTLKGEVTEPIIPGTVVDGKASFIMTMKFVVDSDQMASLNKRINKDHTYDFKII